MHFCPVKIRRGFESSSVCVGMYNSEITNALARVPDGQDKKSLALLSVLFLSVFIFYFYFLLKFKIRR